MGQHSDLIDELDAAIELDRINLARNALAKLDIVVDSDVEVQAYFHRNVRSIKRLRDAIAYLDDMLLEMRSNDGWTLSAERKDGTMAYYKHVEDSSVFMGKVEALIPCELEDLPRTFTMLTALLNEADLMPKWYPLGVLKSHQVLLSPSVFSKATHVKVKLPFPINRTIGPRDCIISAQGFDMAESRSAAITLAPLEAGSDFHNLNVPAPEKGVTRCALRGLFHFEAREDGLVLKHFISVDINADSTPSALKHWFSRGDLLMRLLSRIKTRLARFEGSDWESRIQEDTTFYQDLEDRMADVVRAEFGVEARRYREGSASSQKRSVIHRLSLLSKSLRRRKGTARTSESGEGDEDGDDASHEDSLSLDEAVEETESIDTASALLDSVWKIGMDMLESCTAAVGVR